MMGHMDSFNISMPCYIYISLSLQLAANDFLPSSCLSSKPSTESCKALSEMYIRLSKMQTSQQFHD